jgi:hypothetical protein
MLRIAERTMKAEHFRNLEYAICDGPATDDGRSTGSLQ